jgi:ketosteroid isomerase-like protein
MSPRFSVLLLALLACAKSTTNSSSGAAPVAAASENDEAGRQALNQLEDDWAKALEGHDTTFIARVIAPDFRASGDSAKTWGRAEVMREAADTTVQWSNLRDEDRQIRIYGNGTVGVVTARSLYTLERGEHPGQYISRYTETWVKRDGQWQVVAGHYSSIPSSQP